MPRGQKKDTAPSPANLFIAQDIRPRDLSGGIRRWKRTMETLAGAAAARCYPNAYWGSPTRYAALNLMNEVFRWLRSGR